MAVIPNFFDERVKLPKEFLKELQENFSAGKVLSRLRICQAIPDSQHYKKPVVQYKSKGSKKAIEDFRKLTVEVLGL